MSIPTQDRALVSSALGWQNRIMGTNLSVPGTPSVSDISGNSTAVSADKALAGTTLTAGTYYYFIPTSGCAAVDVSLRTSGATGTGLATTATFYLTFSDNVTQKGGASAFGTFVNGTVQTVSVTTLRGERGGLLKLVVPAASSVTFDLADHSSL